MCGLGRGGKRMKKGVKQLIEDMKKIGFTEVQDDDEIYSICIELNNCRETRIYFTEDS